MERKRGGASDQLALPEPRAKDVRLRSSGGEALPRLPHHRLITPLIPQKQTNKSTKNNRPKSNNNSNNRTRSVRPAASRPRNRPSAPAAAQPRRALTVCASDYAVALTNPFQLSPSVPICYPGMLTMPSQKLRVRTFGEFAVNADGIGGVAYFPFRMLCSDIATSGGSYHPALITTNATYSTAAGDFSFANGPSVPTVSTTVNCYGGYSSPYTIASFAAGSARGARLVAAGLKVIYTGKLLDNAGTGVTYRHPYVSNGLPAVRDSIQDLTAIPSTAQRRVDNDPFVIAYQPLVETDCFVVTSPTFGNVEGAIVDRLGGGVFIKGAEPGTKFTYEAIAYFECIGQSLPLTVSHSDPTGVAAVINAVSHAPSVTIPSAAPVLSAAGEVLRAAAPALRWVAKEALKRKAVSVVGRIARSTAQAAIEMGH